MDLIQLHFRENRNAGCYEVQRICMNSRPTSRNHTRALIPEEPEPSDALDSEPLDTEPLDSEPLDSEANPSRNSGRTDNAAEAEFADAPPVISSLPEDVVIAQEVPEKGSSVELRRDELRSIIGYLDQLFGNLPKEKVEEFATSHYFALYKISLKSSISKKPNHGRTERNRRSREAWDFIKDLSTGMLLTMVWMRLGRD